MSDILKRIKRAIIAGNYEFSIKALVELDADGLTESDALESILNSVEIFKTIRSTSLYRRKRRELPHVIIGTTLDGIAVYTKGKLVAHAGIETYYFLVSSNGHLADDSPQDLSNLWKQANQTGPQGLPRALPGQNVPRS